MALDHRLLFQKLRTAIQERGILAVARQVLGRLQTADDGFDSGRGTDTGGIIELWRLNIDGENKKYGFHYQPTLEAELRDAISFAVRERRDFVFVDLGCGKGKTLLIAADMGFVRIIGVDF